MFSFKLYLLTLLPAAAMAAVNGRCTGPAATGHWGTDGICISTGQCSQFHGVSNPAPACPNDPDDIQCCVIGLDGSSGTNPCGGASYCTWTSNSCPGGFNSAPFCPGGNNYQCCTI